MLNKACSQLVQGDATGDPSLINEVKQYLKTRYKKQGNVFCGLVHRIDRPCSGIVLFAKTSKCLSRMNELLRAGQVKKYYWAIVEGHVQHSINESAMSLANEDPTTSAVTKLRHYLIKDSSRNKSKAFDSPAHGRRESQLRYRILKAGQNYSLLEVELLTGRHHQIRVQLAHVGLRIRGDVKYGARRANAGRGISLHARSIAFEHPVRRERIAIVADPLPVQTDDLFGRFAHSGKVAR